MQRILDYQLPWACVLEDDFCLEADPDFGLCEIEEQLPQPFHYIHLQRDWGWNPKFQVRERLGAFERIAGTPLGIAGYIIHAELADQILGNHHRIEMPIDHFFDSLGRHSELFFRPVRPLVGIQAGLDSTIQVNQE